MPNDTEDLEQRLGEVTSEIEEDLDDVKIDGMRYEDIINRAKEIYDNGNIKEAINYYTVALLMNPLDQKVYDGLDLALKVDRSRIKSKKLLKQKIQAIDYLNQGREFYKKGEPKKAVKQYKKALKKDPLCPPIPKELCIAYTALEKESQAKEALHMNQYNRWYEYTEAWNIFSENMQNPEFRKKVELKLAEK